MSANSRLRAAVREKDRLVVIPTRALIRDTPRPCWVEEVGPAGKIPDRFLISENSNFVKRNPNVRPSRNSREGTAKNPKKPDSNLELYSDPKT